jgi:hypothetical protein
MFIQLNRVDSQVEKHGRSLVMMGRVWIWDSSVGVQNPDVPSGLEARQSTP